MDKVTFYKQKIHAFIENHAEQSKPVREGQEVYAVTDDLHGHYLMYHSSWGKSSRNYGCFLHIRIKNEKVYIEHDGTDSNFANLLVEEGIPKEDIVLAFHPEMVRPHTGFGVC